LGTLASSAEIEKKVALDDLSVLKTKLCSKVRGVVGAL
jgi:hypothetical protein